MNNILFLHAGAEMYGADKVMLDLIKRLDKKRYKAFVILPTEGVLVDALKAEGICVSVMPYPIMRRKYFNPVGIVRYGVGMVRYVRKIAYRPRDVIYLEQPVDAAETELIQRQRATLALLSEIYGDRLIVRRHPGMKNEKKGDYRYDTDYDMWELVAAKQISRENILIGEYSTAQITPKLLFGKEP